MFMQQNVQSCSFGQLARVPSLPLVGCVVASVTFAVSPAGSATLRVPEEFPTIASAANVAAKGDTILISAGVHVEPAFLQLPSGLRLIGDGTLETVTVRFQGLSVLPLPVGDTTETLVEHIGFESLNGGVQKFDVIRNPLAIVRHNRFLTNGTVRFLGGATFEHNIVIMSQPESQRYTIAGDQGLGTPSERLTFAYNTVSLSSGGFFFAAEGSIESLDFHHNTLVYPLWQSGGFPTSMSGWDYGGGDYDISSNVFWGVWLACSDFAGLGGSIEFRNNCFYTWITDPTFPCPDPAAGTANLVEDPLLCDVGQSWTGSFDWRLQPASPCVGAGEAGTNIGALGVGCGLVDVASEVGTFDHVPIVVSPLPSRAHVSLRIRNDGEFFESLSIFDSSGSLVSTLDRDLVVRSGSDTVVRWDGRTLDRAVAPSGVYFFRALEGTGRVWTSRIVLAR